MKPFEIIELVGTRSVRHLWHRRWVIGCAERKEVGWGGDVDGEVVETVVALERRRRKGMVGRR